MSKEIELSNSLKVEINSSDYTAKVIKSPNVSGTVTVPRYAVYDGKQYKIISIGNDAFEKTNLDSLLFPKDSEVEIFGYSSFYLSTIKHLQIPPKLNRVCDNWCYWATNLADIEVSPKNKIFSYIDNKYLVSRNETLHYAHTDIEEANIPPQIKFVCNNAFTGHKKLKSVIFPTNSMLKSIIGEAFYCSAISKLVLPETLEYIDNNTFNYTEFLFHIEISPNNRKFSLIDKTLLLKKSDPTCNDFDVLIFCRRDAENVKIPSYIKVINDYAFDNCSKLKSLTFESGSNLETIGFCSISLCSSSLKSIVFPPSLNHIRFSGIDSIYELESVEFLGSNIKIPTSCFQCCDKLSVVSFSNATKLEFGKDSMQYLPNKAILKIKKKCRTCW